MKAFVTGGTGFIGSRVISKLRERGDEVVALVRSREKGSKLENLGCELVEGDLSAGDAIKRGVQGCDAVFHIAAVYKVGIPKSQHEAMYEANVKGTEHVLDAAIEARVPRIVYVSTVGVFGNTGGKVVDETYKRNGAEFLSYYDETKYRSHQIALDRIAKGAPIVIVQPGGVYGPDDHSELGNMIDQARTGKLKMKMFSSAGFTAVFVDDVADGIVAACDRGQVGQSYVLGGERTTLGELIDVVCEVADRKPPSRELPPALIKMSIPIGPVVGKVMGFPPNLGELVRTSHNVTFWASHDKASNELGYSPRDLKTGLAQTLAT
ncbi:MAG: NAD-dependent epimerase/dehydratase family protein [Solirubrobacterales bacterium]